MEVFIEPLDPSPHLYVVGAGHVSQHLAHMAAAVGFRIHVIDDREAFANPGRFPDATDIVVDDIPQWLSQANLPATAFIVIVTRGHKHDLDALRTLSGRTFRYVGMIGSRAKVARITEALLQDGAPAGWLEQVHAPIGLRIGAVTPEEIAVSIAAELVAVRRGAAAGERSTSMSPRHARKGP